MRQTQTIFAAVFLLFSMADAGFAGFRRMLVDFAASAGETDQKASLPRPDIDPESEACLGCHNGINASRIEVKNADAQFETGPDGRSSNHPIGMLYEEYQARSPKEFVPLQMLNPNILLIDGRVGCRSCHAMKTSDDGAASSLSSDTLPADSFDCTASDRLTVQGSLTDLCISCHNK